MKIGDLVKHPKGIERVCKEAYALGVVLHVRRPFGGETQVEVLWHGQSIYTLYPENQLEVISETR